MMLPQDILLAIIPLMQSFPLVTWKANADSSVAGESLVLRDSAPQNTAAPILSIFVPMAGAGVESAVELEVLGPRGSTVTGSTTSSAPCALGQKETRALAHALAASMRSGGRDGAEDSKRAGSTPSTGFRPGGLLGELFRDFAAGDFNGREGVRAEINTEAEAAPHGRSVEAL